MADLQITNISKPDHSSPHYQITHIGNYSSRKLKTVEEAIKEMDSGMNTFFVMDNSGKRGDVGIRHRSKGNRFLQTYTEEGWNDKLLNLPQYAP